MDRGIGDIEIMKSEDGSSTLYLPEIDEHYHSTHGAYTESMHVFIQSGLQYINKEELNILEVGFGTGLNAYLTLLEQGRGVFYHSIEKYPLAKNVYEHIWFQGFDDDSNQRSFMNLHQLPWDESMELKSGFMVLKQNSDLLSTIFSHKYDLVYFDAFSPDKQPEMWSAAIFEKIYEAMNMNGVLVTYCAKGVVRRTMMACGFTVERIAGPPGKRHMLRAVKAL